MLIRYVSTGVSLGGRFLAKSALLRCNSSVLPELGPLTMIASIIRPEVYGRQITPTAYETNSIYFLTSRTLRCWFIHLLNDHVPFQSNGSRCTLQDALLTIQVRSVGRIRKTVETSGSVCSTDHTDRKLAFGRVSAGSWLSSLKVYR